MNKYLSIITLNENGLNSPIQRHRITEWIRKHDQHICCLQETHLRTGDLHRLKVKGWKQIFQENEQKKKKNRVARADKIDWKKRGHKENPRRSLHNTQRKNPPRHTHCKYICSQHRSNHIHKENLGGFQERHWQQQNYSRGF